MRSGVKRQIVFVRTWDGPASKVSSPRLAFGVQDLGCELDRSRLKTPSKNRPIELVEERPRIRGALRLFRMRQCLFRCRPWRFRRFRRCSRFGLGV